MEAHYGPDHGAYIWGRSVHNIRIERLWCDVTRGFGRKWSNFFLSLEFSAGLRPDLDAHIWLLHHLFLGAINEDTYDWARTWNEHKIRLADERTRSPRDLFFFGMIENGIRGFDGAMVDDDDVEDLETYGVDWEELHSQDIIAHHAENNAEEDMSEAALTNPFSNEGPHSLSHVEVEEPLCPFSSEHVAALDDHLALNLHSLSRNMNSRRALWMDALAFCRSFYDD
ncbi:hypothetical protein GGX14DRAFT_343911 [Mycena pura]|uniref:Integrase core domain-containing protein n=1 Tax=Mycena pura TaxID=153505 RepID=A0AAD7E5L6_9AGAR|nr:hypothetical protein GGX14DRAFT_343911 [Mycena pura]